MKTENPKTKECEWGVYDEYLFEHVFNKLKNAAGKPQMIFALTTTNHTPFHLPKRIPLSRSIHRFHPENPQSRRGDGPENLTNLQYSNDCLGCFLDEPKSSPFAENTIVIGNRRSQQSHAFDFRESQGYYNLCAASR
ncbi:MAG: sulfatase-like hydrolase/transferase [Bacteroidetes bacterium]|nr:sulfatase-like hydrolase/transferase [Bacteroidota bacterium]